MLCVYVKILYVQIFKLAYIDISWFLLHSHLFDLFITFWDILCLNLTADSKRCMCVI